MSIVTKPKMTAYQHHVLVCIGEKCAEKGKGDRLYNELKEKLKSAGLNQGELQVKKSRVYCLGTCMSGPLICVEPDGIWYYDVTSEKLDRIITEHFIQGNPITEYIYHQTQT